MTKKVKVGSPTTEGLINNTQEYEQKTQAYQPKMWNVRRQAKEQGSRLQNVSELIHELNAVHVTIPTSFVRFLF